MDVNPELDLVLERIVDIPSSLIWKAWTTPYLLKQWFAPQPWTSTDARVDLRPGGEFSVTMRSPDGMEFPAAGCYLVVEENKHLAWTDALQKDFRPNEKSFFTCHLTMEDLPGGKTKYIAHALHKNAQDCKSHADMGFLQGWSTCLDQLVKVMKNQ